MLSLLLLCWAFLKLHSLGTCQPLQRATSSFHDMAESLKSHKPDKTKPPGRYYLEKEKGEGAEKQIYQGSEGNIYWRIMKNHKFLFRHSKENLHILAKNHRKACWIHYIKQQKDYDAFHLCWRNVVVRLQQKINLQLSELSSIYIVKRHKKDKRHRGRRSWHTDPSDPLGSEYPNVRAMSIQKNVPEYHSYVSKETIISVDDPLSVLLSHIPLSPAIEKHRIHRKVWF